MRLFIFSILFFNIAFAGSKLGNGGLGMICYKAPYTEENIENIAEQTDIYLIDLVENGIYHPFYFLNSGYELPGFLLPQSYQGVIADIFSQDLLYPQELIEHASNYMKTVEMIYMDDFPLTQDYPLESLELDQKKYTSCKKVQLAAFYIEEEEIYFMINLRYWPYLSSSHRLAVLLHEIFYSFYLKDYPRTPSDESLFKITATVRSHIYRIFQQIY